MTPAEYSALRAEVARRVNKARGTPEDVQQRIRELYFASGLTARQVAQQLGVSHGAVRSTVSRAYSKMTLDERKKIAKNGGRWLGGGQ